MLINDEKSGCSFDKIVFGKAMEKIGGSVLLVDAFEKWRDGVGVEKYPIEFKKDVILKNKLIINGSKHD